MLVIGKDLPFDQFKQALHAYPSMSNAKIPAWLQQAMAAVNLGNGQELPEDSYFVSQTVGGRGAPPPISTLAPVVVQGQPEDSLEAFQPFEGVKAHPPPESVDVSQSVRGGKAHGEGDKAHPPPKSVDVSQSVRAGKAHREGDKAHPPFVSQTVGGARPPHFLPWHLSWCRDRRRTVLRFPSRLRASRPMHPLSL